MDSSTLVLSVAAFVVLHPWLTALLALGLVYQTLRMLDSGVALPRWTNRLVGPRAPWAIGIGAVLTLPVCGVIVGLTGL